ncbi:GldL-related protein [Pedobacter nutrimenti]|uniref:Gliding motility protein GldL-like N-terminal domain-containing protein n=1 Tax=Pedobacter nutrimenti TaxID=1241337 RepID=A0A318UK64_9SPHI|nr:hypothetical protein [Pedobacter nutrimenti]PYF68428.1 hypothetical protein B0O44_11212 [Pedobacter nutrimenti]
MSKNNIKFPVQKFVSFSAAIIIAGLAAKISHFPGSDYVMLTGFVAEIIMFIILGITYKEPKTQISGSPVNERFISDLQITMAELNKTLEILANNTELNSKINTALVNEIGIKGIAEALSKPNELSSLNVQELQVMIDRTGNNMNVLNKGFITLHNVVEDLSTRYSKQINAFKSN